MLLQKEMEEWVQQMKEKPVSDEEWEEFQEYMKEYYKKKKEKEDKFKESLLYSIYLFVKDKISK
mgnify:FL=1